jgi:hypothetical protein
MPNPSQADLHVNVPLTNVSIAYMQNSGEFIADKVFPKVPVKKQSDLYWKYSKSDWRRTDVKKRAPSTESPGTGWNVTTDSYFCHVYAVHKDIDDQVRANQDSPFNTDRDATEFVTNQQLLKRDLEWNATYFKTGVWGTDKTGVASAPNASQFLQWNDPGSDPISDMQTITIEFRRTTGFAPNIMVFGAHTMAALKQHPDIIDRIKYTQKGVVTEDLIATLFGINEIYTSYATVAAGPQMPDMVAQDAAATYDFMTNSKSALVLYAPKSPSLLTPSAGYTFTWSGYLGGNSQGVRIKRFRMEHIASDRVESEATWDQKVVCNDLGYFLSNAVA